MPASDSQFDDRQLEQLLQSALQQQARPAGEDVRDRHLSQIVEAVEQLPDAAVSDPALRRLPWWRRQLARGTTMLSTKFKALATKAVAAATVTMMATGGVAVAGELPAGAQDAVSDAALEVGVDLPTAAEVQLEDELAAFTTELEIGEADVTVAEDTGSELGDSEESAASEVVAADGRRQFGAVFGEKVAALQQDCATRIEAASSRKQRRQVRADCRTQMKELRGELRQARRTMAAPGVARIVAGEIGSDRAREVHAVLAGWHQTRQEILAALHVGELTEDEAEALLQDAARQKADALAQGTDEPAETNEADTDETEEAGDTRPAHVEERRQQAVERRDQRREHAEERREQRREHAEERRSTSEGDPDAQREQAERHRDERQQLRERHAEQRRETRPSRPAHANGGSSGEPQEADDIDDSDEPDESEVEDTDDDEPSEDSDAG